MDLLTGLNPTQQQAVQNTDGPTLILAGAGSGKTRVLTHKIAYLIQQGIDPTNILSVTFTNKAAGEMKERLQLLLGQDADSKNARAQDSSSRPRTPSHPIPPWTGTFHSICSKILRRHIHHLGFSNSFVIYDSGDQTDTIKQVMDQLHIRPKEDKVNPNAVRAKISDAKNHMVEANDYKRFANGYFETKVAQIYPLYQQKLQDNNAVDFDDLLNLTIQLFRTMPDLKDNFSNTFQYIFIDEYQDTNEAQYMLVKMLAAKHRNITVVGDMSQSIYSFRGATIQNILNFEKDYPDAKIFHLEQNYRSTQNILTAATHIILPNQKSHTILKLWTENGVGDPIITYQAEDETDEAQFVAQKVKDLVDHSSAKIANTGYEMPAQVHLSDIAVLYRTNAQSRALEEALLRSGIPYRLVGGTRFYDRKEIKDVLAYLRLCVNPADSVAFNRVANVPARGIGPATLINGGPKLDGFKRDLELYQNAAQEMTVLELLDFILQHTKYHQYLDDGSEEAESRWENVQELRTVAAEFATAGPTESLQNFLENVALVESETKSKNRLANLDQRLIGEVTLMTLHAAKGLEFEVVFMVGMEEGIFPHSRALLDASEMQEERRLAYVGVTRAKQLLHLVYAQQRALFGSRSLNQVSRFVIDVPEDIITKHSSIHTFQPSWLNSQATLPNPQFQSTNSSLQPNDWIMHPVFGEGQIVSTTNDTIVIDFNDTGLKKLDPAFARLVKINGR
jgi:DNA helicase-2/ATP-dependent DNA helicase PcrA